MQNNMFTMTYCRRKRIKDKTSDSIKHTIDIFFYILTLINAGFFYNYLTRGGGRNHPPPRIFDFRTQKSGFKGTTLKYRQILTSRKKNWVNTPKIGPVPLKSKFLPKCRKSRFARNANFQEF